MLLGLGGLEVAPFTDRSLGLLSPVSSVRLALEGSGLGRVSLEANLHPVSSVASRFTLLDRCHGQMLPL